MVEASFWIDVMVDLGKFVGAERVLFIEDLMIELMAKTCFYIDQAARTHPHQ